MRSARLVVWTSALACLVALAPRADAHAAGRAAQATVLCSDAIDGGTGPGPVPLILGRVGLQTSTIQQPVPLQGETFRLWSKSGLVVIRGTAPVVISVPRAWRARAAITWSNRGLGETSVEHVQACPGGGWLAYPGGFFAMTKGCFPLDVAVATRHRRVWIRMGSRAGCPPT
jgi:hypothetical protein